MKFSCVLLWVFACVSCICVSPFKKKLHLDFFLFSLHFLHLIPCKSLWDITSLVGCGDKCFLCDELGYTDLLFSVQPNLFGTTEAYHSVHRFTTGKTVCHLFCVSSDPAPFNESCPLQASHFYHCFMLWLKDQTHSRQIPEGEREITSLSSPSWKLMSKREREITSKLIS